MPNKRISEFPVTTTLDGSDIFLINHLNSTSTISFSALSAAIASNIPSTGGGDATPIGTVCWFAASAAPTGYLECNGNAVSIALYPDLTTAIYCGDSKNATAQFGYRCTNSNSPSTSRSTAGQFIVLPDLRGEFIRGWDHGRGVDAGRVFGSAQADELKAHTHTYRGEIIAVGGSDPSGTGATFEIGNTGSTGGTETRPRNVALLPCIKALKTVTGDVSTLNFIEKPASPTNGQVLTYNGSTNTWVASAAPNSTSTGSIVAWVNFNGNRNASGVLDVAGTVTNTSRLIRASNNVSSVVRNSAGSYTINFTNPIFDNNYFINGSGSYGSEQGGYAATLFFPDIDASVSYTPHTTNSCTILFNAAGVGNLDVQNGYVSIIR